MPINAKFLAGRAAEHRNRLLAYLPITEPIVLPLLKGGRFVVPQIHLTRRIEAELMFAGNAFMFSEKPLLGDVFQYLWRLHPAFVRPRFPGIVRAIGFAQGRPLWLWRLLLSYGVSGGLAYWRLARAVRRCDLFRSADLIQAALERVRQDEPAEDTGKAEGRALRRNPVIQPQRSLIDNCAHHVARAYGMSPAEIPDIPIALIHQWYREALLSQPDGEFEVIDASDRLLAEGVTS